MSGAGRSALGWLPPRPTKVSHFAQTPPIGSSRRRIGRRREIDHAAHWPALEPRRARHDRGREAAGGRWRV
jgi:hypothetical protein